MFKIEANNEIILASASPRRKELLNSIGITCKVIASDFPEISPESDPRKRASDFALQKALLVAKNHPNSYVIAADTVVALNDLIFEKPKDKNDAALMLKSLSANTHLVFGGIAIVHTNSDKSVVDNSTLIVKCLIETEVTFRRLSPKTIESYLQTAKYLDKAGAYGIQDTAQAFVTSIKGSYTNVIGLDIVRLSEELLKLGIIEWS